MPKQVQLRRGTTVQHASFTGAIGEVTVDTTKKSAVVHDGSTVGGVPLGTEASVAAAAARITAFGTITRLSDGVIDQYKLVKVGSDAAHVAMAGTGLAGPAIGTALNATTGAGQSVTIALLTYGRELPMKMVACAAIPAGSYLEPSGTSGGKVQVMTGGIGTHLCVGNALTAAVVDGDLIDVSPSTWLRVI